MGTSNSKMWLALLALGFVWGSSFILMKMALFDTAGERLFPALDVALGRIAIAGLAMAPLAWTHRAHLTRENLPWLLVVGGLGNSGTACRECSDSEENKIHADACSYRLQTLKSLWVLRYCLFVRHHHPPVRATASTP